MRKLIFAILLFSSLQSFSQMRLYAIRHNENGTQDSIFKKIGTDSCFLNNSFVSFTKEYYEQFFEPDYPNSFGKYTRGADGIWVNFLKPGQILPGTYSFAADNGANDSYSITISPAPGSYSLGMMLYFRANTVNTGAASLNVNGLGSITIVKRVNTTLANGDILANMICLVVYNGTNFVLLNPVVN